MHYRSLRYQLLLMIPCYFSSSALAGEFNDLCAFSLTKGKAMKVSCVINEIIDSKVYCFASQEAKLEFVKDPLANIQKASKNYLEIKAQLDDESDNYTPLAGTVSKNNNEAAEQLQRRLDRNIVSPGARDDKELEWEERRDN